MRLAISSDPRAPTSAFTIPRRVVDLTDVFCAREAEGCVLEYGFWSHRSVATDAWDYLEQKIAPDIALLQECVPVQSVGSNVVFGATSVDRADGVPL